MKIIPKLIHKKYIIIHTIYLVYFSIFQIFHVFYIFAIGFNYITYFTIFTMFHIVSQNILRKCFVKYCPPISPTLQHCRNFGLLAAMLAQAARIPIATILTAASQS